MDVGQRGRRHARSKRRRVELVVGMKHQRDIERARFDGAGTLPFQRVQEVGGMAQSGIGLDGASAVRNAPARRHGGANLSGQLHARPVASFRRHVVGARVEVRQARHDRAQHVHRIARRQGSDEAEHALRQPARCGKLGLELPELRATGQAPMPQEITDLLEGRMLSEIVDVVTPIGQHTPRAVEIADR